MKRLSNLLSVKSLVTLTVVFSVMAVWQTISQDFMTVYAVRIAFYFGSQTSRKDEGYIPQGVYTIAEEKDGFGRLKSGAGWIALKWVKKSRPGHEAPGRFQAS